MFSEHKFFRSFYNVSKCLRSRNLYLPKEGSHFGVYTLNLPSQNMLFNL